MDNELFDNSFQVFRRDRYTDASKLGGGLLLGFRNTLTCSRVEFPVSLNDLDIEIISVRVSLKSKDIYVVNCYIPPSSQNRQFSNGKNIFENVILHLDFLEDIRKPGDEVILLGDFNLPSVDWVYCREDDTCVPTGDFPAKIADFLDNVSCSGFWQSSTVTNSLGRQLDLVFSTENNILVERSPTKLTNIDLYHPPLLITIGEEDTDTPDHSGTPTTFRFNFRKADFDRITNMLLDINFSLEFSSEDINENVEKFYSILFNIFQECVPLERSRDIKSVPPWYNKELITLKNRKNRLWKKHLKAKNQLSYDNFVDCHTTFIELSSALYNTYLQDIKCKLYNDPRTFFKFINVKKKDDGYPSTMRFNGDSSNNSEIITDFFASFFESAFDNESFTPPEAAFSYINSKVTDFIIPDITEDVVAKKLETLSEDYSVGPDKVPPIVLKRCARAFSLPLSILFKSSISSSSFPRLWKSSFIIPIHKKGSKSDIDNYRPIAKLSCIPKSFESIIYSSLSETCKSIISPNQHGFVPNKSTTTNLLEFSSDIIGAFISKSQVDCVYTDFSKAFDKLSHSVIVLKMRRLGFPPWFIEWVTSYLLDRTYKVVFRGVESRSINATSGVPQGSHLGPLLFILAIDDVSLVLKKAKVKIYADDMKLYSTIKSSRDAELLQDDLDRFATWCSDSNLKLNVGKCEFTRFYRIKSPVLFNYRFNNSVIQFNSLVTDLGVVFDKEINFKAHIDKIATKASRMLGFIKRWGKEFNSPLVLRHLYTTFVRPILEYACQVWAPFYQTDIDRVEAVQKRFVRFALSNLPWHNSLILPPYNNRLNLVNLESLSKRREVADLVFLHGLINLTITSDLLDKIKFTNNGRNLRHIRMFDVPSRTTNYGRHESMVRMCTLANSTPSFYPSCSKDVLKRGLRSSL